MPVFHYTAAGSLQGTITADSPRQARQQLRSRGVAVERLSEKSAQKQRRFTRPSASAAKLTATTRELSTLLSAGIGLVEALDVLAQQHRGTFQASLQMLRDEVAAGKGLAEAMREQIANGVGSRESFSRTARDVDTISIAVITTDTAAKRLPTPST